MDFRAVVFMCLLVAQAACGVLRKDTKKEALTRSIQMLQEDLRHILKDLAEPGQLPNMPCLYLNTTELGEPQEQRLTAYHLSSFSCYIKTLFQMRQLSEIFSHLPESLQKICQIVSAMEQLVPDPQAREDCSLPSLEDVELCVYVKCLLQHLDQRLSNARF